MGVIGCGRIAALRHLPVLRELEGVEAVALADPEDERLDAAGKRFGIARRYADHEDLLGDPRVRAVVVCTPAATHAEIVLDALAARKHVLVEKPLCLTLDDADRLVAAAANTHLKTMVGLNVRSHRLARDARRLVRSGALGTVDIVRTLWSSSFDYRDTAASWRQRRGDGGGALVEIAPHHLDLVPFLLDDVIVEVSASSRCDPWHDEAVLITGRTGRGALFSTVVSQRSANRNEADLVGSAGSLSLSLYRYDGLELVAPPGYRDAVGQRVRRTLSAARSVPAMTLGSRRGGDYHESYSRQWRDFVVAVTGDRPVECTVDDGRRNLAAVLAAAKSISCGGIVRVGEARELAEGGEVR